MAENSGITSDDLRSKLNSHLEALHVEIEDASGPSTAPPALAIPLDITLTLTDF
jgi:hypothetical protein